MARPAPQVWDMRTLKPGSSIGQASRQPLRDVDWAAATPHVLSTVGDDQRLHVWDLRCCRGLWVWSRWPLQRSRLAGWLADLCTCSASEGLHVAAGLGRLLLMHRHATIAANFLVTCYHRSQVPRNMLRCFVQAGGPGAAADTGWARAVGVARAAQPGARCPGADVCR